MKCRCLVVSLAASLTILSIPALTSPANEEHAPPLDYHALFKTHVPHINAQIAGGGPPSEGTVQSTTAAIFSGSPATVSATVTPTTTLPEAEEHIAVDPNNSANLVAAISDFSLRGGYNTTKYVFSANNGAAGSWTERFVPLGDGSPATGDGRVWEANSNPVVAIDKLGNVYLADLYFNGSNNANGLYVSVATLSPGVNFSVTTTYTVASNLSPTTNVFEDKEWIAVDNSSNAGTAGKVYVSWTRFVGSSDWILFSCSTDHGQHWSTPVQISPTGQNGAVQGSQVAVGPGGEVYVVYEVFYVGGVRRHFLAKSTNGGVTFSAPVAITPYFNEVRFNSTYRWFDTRNSSSSAYYDIYATYAGTDGSSFHPNARVTPSRVYAGSASFIGDYAGVAAAAGNAHPVWTSGGFNNGLLQTATLGY